MRELESTKLKEYEARLSQAKHTYESMLQVWHTVDRRKLSLEVEIKFLEKQIASLRQGQLVLIET